MGILVKSVVQVRRTRALCKSFPTMFDLFAECGLGYVYTQLRNSTSARMTGALLRLILLLRP